MIRKICQIIAGMLIAGQLIISCTGAPAPCGPLPDDKQIALQDMEMYAFLHYSLNTYTDQEWGYGNEDPALFNPSGLDVRQWVKVCKDAGMKGMILTAKHHCGFCLWPRPAARPASDSPSIFPLGTGTIPNTAGMVLPRL